jgi:hypothetical protein
MLSTLQSANLNTLLPVRNVNTGVKAALPGSNFKPTNTGKANTEISNLSSFALSMKLSEINYSNSSSEIFYRSDDNSLALKANRSINIDLKVEKYQFDLTLSAESLGIDASAFADRTKPLVFQLQYKQTDLMISNDTQIKQQKTLRTADEIIQDLVKGLTKALQDPDKRSIMYTLDDEAIKSLALCDPKLGKLFGELVMIMNTVNLMKSQSKGNHDYTIALTGKGKPYTEIAETSDVKGYSKEYSVNITILPPKMDSANQSALTPT